MAYSPTYEILVNAKIEQDHITTYKVIWSDASKSKLNNIWLPRWYEEGAQVYHNNILWVACQNTDLEPGTHPDHWKPFKIEHGFSDGAQKRFRHALDNFTGVFNAAYVLNKDLLAYLHEGKEKYKKPIFCTLTIPVQKLSDLEVKKKCLDRWLDNLKKHYNIKMFIWRAEAQLRGAIHFHIVFDRFIDEKKARKTWFALLRETDQLQPGQLLHEASNIVRLDKVENIHTLKFELSGYFAAEESKEKDRYVYKHNKSLTVRKIEGNQWGYSDNLKYKSLTFENLMNDHKEYIDCKPLLKKELKDSSDKELGEIFIYRNVFPVGPIIPGQKRKRAMKTAPMHFEIMKRLNYYHYMHAAEIYGGSRIDANMFYELYGDSNFIQIPKPQGITDYQTYLNQKPLWWT